jgi:hypothetical protein
MPGHKLLQILSGQVQEVLGTTTNLDSTAGRIPDTAWHGNGAPLSLTATTLATGTPANNATVGVVVGYATASSLGVSGGSGTTGVLIYYGQYDGVNYQNTVKRIFIDQLYFWYQSASTDTAWGLWTRVLRTTDRNTNRLLASTTPVLGGGTNGITWPLDLTDLAAVSGGAITQHYQSHLRDAGFISGYIDGNALAVPGLAVGSIGNLTYFSVPSSGNMCAEFRFGGRLWSRVGTGSITWGPWKEHTIGLPIQLAGTLVGTRNNLNFIQGANVTLTVSDNAATNAVDVTIAATGGGGGGATNLSYTASPTTGVVVSDTGDDATIPLADSTNSGLFAPAEKTKLATLGASNFYKHAYYAEDFFNNNNLTLGPWQAAAISGGGWSTSPTTGDVSPHHPGVVYIRSGTTASSGFRLATNSYAINFGGGEETNFILNLNSSSVASKTRMGFQDSFTPTDPTDGAVFLAGSDNTLIASCWNNGSVTNVSFANIDKTLWYRFNIRVESTSAVVFSVYLMAGTLVETQTITTNIPTDSARVTGHGLVCWNTGTAVNDICRADYMDIYFPSRVRG